MIKSFFIRYYKPIKNKQTELYSIEDYFAFTDVYELKINMRLLKLYKLTNKNKKQIDYINKLLKYKVKLMDLIQEVIDDRDKFNKYVYTIDYINKIK